ncbi:hypothetical protein LOAG_14154 [Loa loa]|uniref:Uncharacterized protein n=2 Tax=Loa loa TaxID=7209 RepID=A0A1S0TIC8_LOALO|nr:hypothetical protein LOAG_14154 [Loa loa]EFO14367.1 hypothetical protein LOAG_14154 [Loa loa]
MGTMCNSTIRVALLLFIGVNHTVSLFCYMVHWDAYSSFTERVYKCKDDEEFCASLYDRSAESWYLRAIPLDKKCYSVAEEGCFMDPRYNSYLRSTRALPVCICKGDYCNTQEKIENIWLEQNLYRFHDPEDCHAIGLSQLDKATTITTAVKVTAAETTESSQTTTATITAKATTTAATETSESSQTTTTTTTTTTTKVTTTTAAETSESSQTTTTTTTTAKETTTTTTTAAETMELDTEATTADIKVFQLFYPDEETGRNVTQTLESNTNATTTDIQMLQPNEKSGINATETSESESNQEGKIASRGILTTNQEVKSATEKLE